MVWFNSDDIDWNDTYFVITIYGFSTFSNPYEFIEDYLLTSTTKCTFWEAAINFDDYLEDMYNEHFDLRAKGYGFR